MQEEEPMERGFGPAVGRWIRGLLEGHGIEFLGGRQLDRFEGDGRVQLVVTGAGDELDADLVVLGTGVKPDVMLAKAAGLELGESGGVKCDARLQTSAPDLYAAGDICEYDSVVHGRRIRVEHEAVAEAQGAHVAAAMLGSAGAAHRGALLLDRPGRLGLAGVRGPRRAMGRGDRPRARWTTASSACSTWTAAGWWPAPRRAAATTWRRRRRSSPRAGT